MHNLPQRAIIPSGTIALSGFSSVGRESLSESTNVILYKFDELVGQWCRERKISHTRCCDDLIVFGDIDPAEVIRFVRLE